MIKRFVWAVAIAVMGVSGATAATVLNGDFEQDPGTPGIKRGQSFANLNSRRGPSWDTWKSLPGWTTETGYGIEVQSNRTLRSIDAHSGSHYLELDSDNNSSMIQSVMLERGTYLLEFAYSPRTRRAGSNGIDYSVEGIFAGAVLGTQPQHRVGAWSIVSEIFSINTAGRYALRFAATGRSDSHGGLIDTVSIERMGNTPTQVPLPAPAALLGAAVFGLAFLRRMRRTS